MSYSGRRGPNVSHFMARLQNPQGVQEVQEDVFDQESLNLFTNTEFYDLDSAQNTDFRAQPSKIDTAAPTPAVSVIDDPISASSAVEPVSSLDFVSGDFDFTDDFNNQYPAGPLNPYNGSHNFQPVQPNHQLYPGQVAPQQLPPFTQQQPQLRTAGEPRSEKRKADDMSPPSNASTLSMEEQSRHAAEEDKRRRNTAASARFRVKKKQREQALEKSAKDMTEKVTSLESKVSQLETENKWLKNLLVDKSGGGEDINGLWKDFINHRQQIKDKADR